MANTIATRRKPDDVPHFAIRTVEANASGMEFQIHVLVTLCLTAKHVETSALCDFCPTKVHLTLLRVRPSSQSVLTINFTRTSFSSTVVDGAHHFECMEAIVTGKKAT